MGEERQGPSTPLRLDPTTALAEARMDACAAPLRPAWLAHVTRDVCACEVDGCVPASRTDELLDETTLSASATSDGSLQDALVALDRLKAALEGRCER